MSDNEKKKLNDEPEQPAQMIGVSRKHGRERRQLTEVDIKRIHLGRAFWSATLKGIQDLKVRVIVESYLRKINEHINAGRGLVFTGASGVGKSGAAAVLAKDAVRWGYTAYITTHDELQEIRFEDHRFDDSLSVLDRIRMVDLLVLDDFDEDFIDDNKFGPKQLEKLIARRNTNRRASILTTRVSGHEFTNNPKLKSLWGRLQETTIGLTIEGKDLRRSINNNIREIIVGGSSDD